MNFNKTPKAELVSLFVDAAKCGFIPGFEEATDEASGAAATAMSRKEVIHNLEKALTLKATREVTITVEEPTAFDVGEHTISAEEILANETPETREAISDSQHNPLALVELHAGDEVRPLAKVRAVKSPDQTKVAFAKLEEAIKGIDIGRGLVHSFESRVAWDLEHKKKTQVIVATVRGIKGTIYVAGKSPALLDEVIAALKAAGLDCAVEPEEQHIGDFLCAKLTLKSA